MKTLTCAQLGGPNMDGTCNAEVHAETQDEMMGAGMKHLEEAHPEMAAAVKAAPQDDPKMVGWMDYFKNLWETTPEKV